VGVFQALLAITAGNITVRFLVSAVGVRDAVDAVAVTANPRSVPALAVCVGSALDTISAGGIADGQVSPITVVVTLTGTHARVRLEVACFARLIAVRRLHATNAQAVGADGAISITVS
jgi:hypothetical protein